MNNSDKGLTVPIWVLKNQTKVPQMPKNLFAQIACPCPKVRSPCVYQLSMQIRQDSLDFQTQYEWLTFDEAFLYVV